MRLITASLIWALSAAAGQTSSARKKTADLKSTPTVSAPAAPSPSTPGLSLDDIIKMVEAKVSESIIVSKVKKNEKAFDLSPDQLIVLKKAAASDGLIEVLMDPSKAYTPPSPTPAPPAPTSTPTPVSAATVSTEKPSMEIGIYFKKAEAWMEVLPEVVNWKTGGALKSLATATIVKKDLNGNITGPGSRNSIKSPLEFLIVAAEGVSITEYQLIRLRLNKDYREFRTVTGGILNQQSGAMRDMVPFEGKKLSPHTFSVVLPNNLGAGEYGFLSPGAVGSSGNSQAQIGKMYTFHIVE